MERIYRALHTDYHSRILLVLVIHSTFGYANRMLMFSFNVLKPEMLAFMNKSMQEHYSSSLTEGGLNWLWGLTACCDAIGGMVGCLMVVHLLEKCGRRRTVMIVANAFALLSCMLQVTAKPVNCFELIIIGRFLGGIAVILSQSGVTYMSECAATRIRGAASTVLQTGTSLWLLIAIVTAMRPFMGTDGSWPLFFAVPILPIIIHMAFSRVFPESPKYLYINEQNEPEAIKSIQYYHGDGVDLDQIFDEYDSEIDAFAMDGKTATWGEIWRNRSMQKPLLICVVAQLASTFNGNGLGAEYGRSLIHSFGVPEYLTLTMMLVCIVLVVAASLFFSLVMVESVGRRPLIIAATAVATLGILLVMIATFLKAHDSAPLVSAVVGMAGASAMGLSDVIGLVGLPGLFVGELCPQASRAKVNGLTSFIWQSGLFIQVVLFPPLKNLVGAWCYLPLLIIEVSCLIWFWYHMPETKQRSVAAIVHGFDDDTAGELGPLVGDYFTPTERASLRRRSRRGRRRPAPPTGGDGALDSWRRSTGATANSGSNPATTYYHSTDSGDINALSNTASPHYNFTDTELDDEKNYDHFLRAY